MVNINNDTSINPLQMIQQRFLLIDLAVEILVIDNEQEEKLKQGSFMTHTTKFMGRPPNDYLNLDISKAENLV